MRKLLGTLALLPLGLQTLAQAPAPKSADVVVLQAPSSAGCPVGFEARHAQQGAVVNVSQWPKHPEQSYRITFTSLKAPAIVAAQVTLHGISGQHVLPVGQAPARAQTSESFNLAPSSGDHHLFHSTVYAQKLTGVQWVELNELTYADGTRWHESDGGSCRVVPNGFMLVAGK